MKQNFPRWVQTTLSSLILFGCSIAPGHCAESHDAASWPTKGRLKEALLRALRTPATWAPAAGAAVMASTDWDGKVSRWAVERSPVFGSPHTAREWSDPLRGATHLGMIATALAVPGPQPSWKPKLQRLLVEQAGARLAVDMTNIFKDVTQRERPDASDQGSFPSAHSSKAFAYSSFASRNLHATQVSDAARRGIEAGLYTLAVGTAWSRVEGGVHYPSDVMAGAALGNFMAFFIHDAFLGGSDRVAVDVELHPDSPSFQVRLSF